MLQTSDALGYNGWREKHQTGVDTRINGDTGSFGVFLICGGTGRGNGD